MKIVQYLAAACLMFLPESALAQTKASQKVPELKLGSDANPYDVSQKDFELIPSQGYRWPISSNGNLEYKLHSTLFRNVWMNQIVIEDMEVHMNGAPAWLEFDSKGTIMVQFSTVRPGEYEWWVEGLEDKGMKGKITIK
jgi:hypothetical protein